MSRLYQRVKGAFQRNRYSSRQYYDPYPDSYNEGEIDHPEQWDEGEIEEDVENVRNNNPRPQRTSQNQARGRPPLDENPPTTSPKVRTVPHDIQSNLSPNTNLNTNINPPVINNPVPIANPPLPTGLPAQDPTSHPPINPNQTPQPLINPVPQPSTRAGIPFAFNRKRRPFRINPDSTLVGFPRSLTSQHSSFDRPSFPRQQSRLSFPSHFSPSPRQNNISNMEIDYPTENVFIDGNISSAIAIKINEAIEHDRFGNAYYTHRYAYQPKTQHITMRNNSAIERRFIGNSHPTGFRYIREIDYPQQQNLNHVPLIIDNSPQLNYFPAPVHHFIAYAAPNDPMRYY